MVCQKKKFEKTKKEFLELNNLPEPLSYEQFQKEVGLTLKKNMFYSKEFLIFLLMGLKLDLSGSDIKIQDKFNIQPEIGKILNTGQYNLNVKRTIANGKNTLNLTTRGGEQDMIVLKRD